MIQYLFIYGWFSILLILDDFFKLLFFHIYLMSTCRVPDNLLCTENIMVWEKDVVQSSWNLYSHGEKHPKQVIGRQTEVTKCY